MIQDFKSYLSSQKVISQKKSIFYVRWVNQLYLYYKTTPESGLTQQQINEFLSQLSKHYQQWQVVQAGEAIQFFLFFRRRKAIEQKNPDISPDDSWKLHADDLARMIRLKQLSTSKAFPKMLLSGFLDAHKSIFPL